MFAGGHGAGDFVGSRRLVPPLIDNKLVVHPHPDSIVGGGAEGVADRLEAVIAGPAGREVVGADPVARALREAPVVVDGVLAATEVGLALKPTVAVVTQPGTA